MRTEGLALGCAVIFCLFGFDTLRGQNIVERTATRAPQPFTANPVRLTDTDVSEFFFRAPRFGATAASTSPEARRVSAKLEAHIIQFLDGAPWMPFHHTLGISGYETYFTHPDELFYALSIVLPCLPGPTGNRLKTFLREQLERWPPYAEEGFDTQAGRPRESYDVPMALRLRGRGRASSAFGVYAFWAYVHFTGDTNAARAHWPAVQARMKPLLAGNDGFDLKRKDSNKGEAQKLNGDLAGLIGFIRLGQTLGRDEETARARTRARELMELRVNLERMNPHLLEKSDLASKGLHNARLSRYCDLVSEAGAAVAKFSADCGAHNLKLFREERNGWFLAFGDRLIGGENYTNPAHFPRSVFAGVAFIEQLPPEQLLAFIDVPWCKGDFYFMEKCVLALWACEGRPWIDL